MPSVKHKLPKGTAYPMRYSDLVGALQGVVEDGSLYARFVAYQSLDQGERERLRNAGIQRLVELEFYDERTEAARNGAERKGRDPRPGMSAWIHAVPRQDLRDSGLSRDVLSSFIRDRILPLLGVGARVHQRRARVVLDASAKLVWCSVTGTDALEVNRGTYRQLGDLVLDVSGLAAEVADEPAHAANGRSLKSQPVISKRNGEGAP